MAGMNVGSVFVAYNAHPDVLIFAQVKNLNDVLDTWEPLGVGVRVPVDTDHYEVFAVACMTIG